MRAGAITGFVIGLILAWPAMTGLAHRTAGAPRPARRWILLATVRLIASKPAPVANLSYSD